MSLRRHSLGCKSKESNSLGVIPERCPPCAAPNLTFLKNFLVEGIIIQAVKRLISLTLIATVALGSCQSKTTEPQPVGFQFRVEVVDPLGQPVSGLRVSAWNLLRILSPVDRKSLGLTKAASFPCPTAYWIGAYPNPFKDSVRVVLDVPESARVSLSIQDLLGDELASAVDTVILCATARDTFTLPAGYATAYRLTARIETNYGPKPALSAFVARQLGDPAENTLGFTGAGGSLLSMDSIRFPSLFDIPEMLEVDDSGYIHSRFEYWDSVQIVLTDTATGQEQAFTEKLVPCANLYQLTWSP